METLDTVQANLLDRFELLKNETSRSLELVLSDGIKLANLAKAGEELEIECEILIFLGRGYRLNGNAFKSISCLNKAYINHNAHFPHKRELLAQIFRELGNVYSNSLQDHETGVDYSLKGYKLNIPKFNAIFLNNIGSNYMNLGRLEEATRFLKKGILSSSQSENQLGLSYLHHNLGEVLLKQKKPKQGLLSLNDCVEHCKSFLNGEHDKLAIHNINYIYAYSYHTKCQAYIALEEYDKVEKLLSDGKSFCIENNQDPPLSSLYILEGELLQQKQDLKAYDFLFEKAIKFCEEKSFYLDKKKWLEQKQQISERNKDYESAYKMAKLVIKNNEEIKLKHKELNVSNLLVSKEEEILALEDKNRIMQIQKDELKQFAYIVTHDLKTPLSNISNFIGLFQRKYGNKVDEKGKEYVDYILSSAKHLTTMLSDLLQYISLDKKEELPFQESQTREIFEGICKNSLLDLEKVDIEVSKNVPIPIRPFHLEIVLDNLIKNAIKFKQKDTALRLQFSCKELDSEFLIQLGDNGIGIEEKYQSQIFDIFKRLNTTETSGTGIGLSICKKIIQSYGGKIWVVSNVPVGTLINFTISKNQLYHN